MELALVLLGGRGGVHELHSSPQQQEGAGEDGVEVAMVKGRGGVGGVTKEGVGEAVWGLGFLADGRHGGGGGALVADGVEEEEGADNGSGSGDQKRGQSVVI